MSRRIEVELTSEREDGSWTWRAAGARQPRGVLDGSLLYQGAKAGDVVRADADFEVDGIFITAVLPPKAGGRREPERLEVIGPSRPQEGVTTSLVGRDRGRREPGAGRPQERDRAPRARPGREAERPPRAAGGERPRRERGARPDGQESRPDSPAAARGSRGREHDERRRPTGRGPGRAEGRPAGAGSERRPSPARGAGEPPPGTAEEERARPRRLSPAHVHRAAVLESL